MDAPEEHSRKSPFNALYSCTFSILKSEIRWRNSAVSMNFSNEQWKFSKIVGKPSGSTSKSFFAFWGICYVTCLLECSTVHAHASVEGTSVQHWPLFNIFSLCMFNNVSRHDRVQVFQSAIIKDRHINY